MLDNQHCKSQIVKIQEDKTAHNDTEEMDSHYNSNNDS